MIAPWPEAHAERSDASAEQAVEALIELIGAVRGLKAEYDVPPASKVDIHLTDASAPLAHALGMETRAVERLAGVGNVFVTPGTGEVSIEGHAPVVSVGPAAHAVLRGGTELTLPLAGVIDLERETERLGKERARLQGLLRGTEGKLTNEQFRSRAPAEVVVKEEEKAVALRDQVDRLTRKLAALGGEGA
jgi:valyl-tRNA synthetase